MVRSRIVRPTAPTLLATLSAALLLAATATTAAPPSPAPQEAPVLAPPSKTHKPAKAEPKRSDSDSEPKCAVRATFVKMRPHTEPAATTPEERRAEQVGRLFYARIDLSSDGAPLREVLRAFRNAIGLNLAVLEERVVDGTMLGGIDGSQPIDLALSSVDGFEVLDQLAAQVGTRASWQLDGAVVQFGLKSTLKDLGKRTEAKEVGDLALLAPDWIGPRFGPGFAKALEREAYNRLDSDQVLGDLARLISTHCEPEAFEPDPERNHSPPSAVQKHTAAKNGPNGAARTRSNPNTNAPYNFMPEVGPIYVHGKWATLQTHGTTMSFSGPDFVLRQIVGYPEPLAPRESAPPAAGK